MMSNLSLRRRWLLVAAGGSLLILALGWFIMVSPEKSDRTDKMDQIANAQAKAAVTRAKLRGLEADNASLARYQRLLAGLREALPSTAGSAKFVSDMQSLSQSAGVTITSINLTPPQSAAAGTTSGASGLTQLPIVVSASGTTAQLDRFLFQLENKSDRALLVSSVTESVPTVGSADSGEESKPTVSVQMTAFFTAS